MSKVYKRRLDFRIKEDRGSEDMHSLYILEEQRQLFGMKYWSILDVSLSKKHLVKQLMKLNNGV